MIVNWVELFFPKVIDGKIPDYNDGFWRMVPEPVKGITVTENIQQMRVLMQHTYGATKYRFSQTKMITTNSKNEFQTYTGEI